MSYMKVLLIYLSVFRHMAVTGHAVPFKLGRSKYDQVCMSIQLLDIIKCK